MNYRHYRLPPGAGWGIFAIAAFLIFALVFIPAKVAGQSFEALGLSMLQGLVVGGVMLLWRQASLTVFESRKLVPQPVAETLQSAFLHMQMGQEMGQQYTGELVRQKFGVSLGGAVVPLIMSLYFATGIEHFEQALPWLGAGVAVVGGVCFAALKLQPGQPPRVSMLIPPLAVAVACLAIQGQPFAPQVAYMAAVFGTLLGTGAAPLLWPPMRKRLDAPAVIIGGPGVFGGLFLACLAAGLFS